MIRAQNILIKGLTNLTITMKSNSDKNQTKLPWWVELLFVQVGLPDRWLSKYLKKRKEALTFIDTNKGQNEIDFNSIAVGYCHGGSLPNN